ncbi:MAG: Probable poly(beta-D-mannuronate) O-acetylase, partial [uncultured Nocardioidaceae bacterium]
LHPARRQPRLVAHDLPQPVHRLLPDRHLARRGLDVRRVGPVPRRAARLRARDRAGADRRRDLAVAAPGAHLPARRRRVGLLPGRRHGPRARDAAPDVRPALRRGAGRGDDRPDRPAHAGVRPGHAGRAHAARPRHGQGGRREPHAHRRGGPGRVLGGRCAVRRGARRRRHLQPVPVLPVL